MIRDTVQGLAVKAKLKAAPAPAKKTPPSVPAVVTARILLYLAVLVGLSITRGRLHQRWTFVLVLAFIVATLVVDSKWSMGVIGENKGAKLTWRIVLTPLAITAVGVVVATTSSTLGGAAPNGALGPSTFLLIGVFVMFLGFGMLVDALRTQPFAPMVITVVAAVFLLVVGFQSFRFGGGDHAILFAVGFILTPIAVGLVSEWLLEMAEPVEATHDGTDEAVRADAGAAKQPPCCCPCPPKVEPPKGPLLHRAWDWVSSTMKRGSLLARSFFRDGSSRAASVVVLVLAFLAVVWLEQVTPLTVLRASIVVICFTALLFLVVSRSNLDTTVVAVVVAISWASSASAAHVKDNPTLLLATPATTFNQTNPAQDDAFVSIGDSYMSGEGASTFYSGTNDRGQNECHRAPTAYTVTLSENTGDALPHHAIFLACSGAVVDNFDTKPQYPNEPPPAPSALQADGQYAHGLVQLAQLKAIRDQLHPNITLAFVSIGGNDAGFSDLAKLCIGPGDCSTIAQPFFAAVTSDATDGLSRRLDRAYHEIGAALSGIRTIVVPYPVPIDDTPKCSFSELTLNERVFLKGFTEQLDAVITREALNAGFEVAPTQTTFLDSKRALCDTGNPNTLDANWLTANPTDGAMAQLINPSSWIHDTFHPNARGHQDLAATLAKYLTTTPAQNNPKSIRTLAQVMCPTVTHKDATTCTTAASTTWRDLSSSRCVAKANATTTFDPKNCTYPFLLDRVYHAVLGSGGALAMLWLLVAWAALLVLVAWYRKDHTPPEIAAAPPN